jgi:hypothetical protein
MFRLHKIYHQGVTASAYLKLHCWFQFTCRYSSIQCYGGICRHSIEYGYSAGYNAAIKLNTAITTRTLEPEM